MSINVNNTTISNLLDLIAPHSCRGCGRVGNILCNRCKNNILDSCPNICPFCKSYTTARICERHTSFPSFTVVCWRESIIGALIYDLKFHSIRSAAKPLAEILHQTLPKTYSNLIVVPLPTIKPHIRKRGLDHTLLIAKYLAKYRKSSTKVSRLLLRSNNTTQVGSTRKKRLIQVRNAYTINPKVNIEQNTTYLLLDDVWTTGASMLSAIKTLQENGITNIEIAILSLSQ